MSVLVDRDMEKLVETCKLIDPFDSGSLEGASYDMRLGKQYGKTGVVKNFSSDKSTFALQPGEFATLTTYETLNLPKNIIGNNGVMSPWAKVGLVSLFSPQIDPGFCGRLVVPVFNAGDAPISFNYKDKIFTVFFLRTLSGKNARVGWSDRFGRQQGIKPAQSPRHTGSLSSGIGSEIDDLRRHLGAAEKKENRMSDKLDDAEKRIRSLESTVKIIESRVEDRRYGLGLKIALFGIALALLSLAFSFSLKDIQVITERFFIKQS